MIGGDQSVPISRNGCACCSRHRLGWGCFRLGFLRCHPNGVFWLQKSHDLVLWIVTNRLLNPHLGKERLVHESGHALGTENPRLLAYGDNPFLEPPNGDGWIGSANGEVFPEYAVGVVGTQYPVLYLQVLVVVFGCFLLPMTTLGLETI